MNQLDILGIPITNMRLEQLLVIIDESIKQKNQLTIVAINARKAVKCYEDKKMKSMINQFDIYLADGSSIVKALHNKVNRITGIDLMENICKLQNPNYKIFLYGALEENNLLAQKKLKELYPHLNIVGYSNGYNDNDVINKINESQANILFVAKGTPKQEYWIQENKKLLNVNILLGVGGALDVYSGKLKRCPTIIQKLGFEWLYRMIKEPKRFKQIPELIKFEILFFKSGGKLWK